jgi:anti-sigma B factor antagonist
VSLQIRTEKPRDGAAVVAVEGELDVHSSPALKEAIVQLVDDGTLQLVIDLDGVDYLDSTGLGVLLGGTRRATAAGGTLSLICSNERLLRILEITGLNRLLRISRDQDEALQAA